MSRLNTFLNQMANVTESISFSSQNTPLPCKDHTIISRPAVVKCPLAPEQKYCTSQCPLGLYNNSGMFKLVITARNFPCLD